MKKLSISKVHFPLSHKFTTIVCTKCDREYILYAVFRYKDEYTGDDEVDIMEQGASTICPFCGKNPHIE